MALQKILDTTELLESVLVYADFKTLLLSQRVSRRFQDVIAGSTKLQKKLFFQTIGSYEEAEALEMINDKAVAVLNGRRATCSPHPHPHAVVNLALFMTFKFVYTCQSPHCRGHVLNMCPKPQLPHNGSWQRMYVFSWLHETSSCVGQVKFRLARRNRHWGLQRRMDQEPHPVLEELAQYAISGPVDAIDLEAEGVDVIAYVHPLTAQPRATKTSLYPLFGHSLTLDHCSLPQFWLEQVWRN